MEPEVMRIAATLATGGIRIDVLQANTKTEVFVAELPNGTQYLFSKGGLLKMRDDGKLTVPGIESSGVRR